MHVTETWTDKIPAVMRFYVYMANTKPEGTVNALQSKSATNSIKWYGTFEG
jgi:hypothetical protein